MLAKWTKLLPLFIVEFLAKKLCERIEMPNGKIYSNPYQGVLLRVKTDAMIKERNKG